MIARLRRLRHRLRWRRCRHCGAPVYHFTLRDHPRDNLGRRGHWAHVYGEAHCGAACSRWRRCRCKGECDLCGAQFASVREAIACEEAHLAADEATNW